MQQLTLPGTALFVSPLCLGGVPFGLTLSESATFALLDRFVELGGNFIDTARIYSDWQPGELRRSERVLGDWLQARPDRHRLVIATKGAHPFIDSLDVPRHRTHFTPRGLRALLDRAGFDVVAEHHVLTEHNPFGMWQTLVSRATRTPSWLFRALQRDAPLASRDAVITLMALPLIPLAALLELAAGAARRGGTVAFVVRARG